MSLVAVQTVVRSRMLQVWRSTEELVLRRWIARIPARIRAKFRGILISSASLKTGPQARAEGGLTLARPSCLT
jgi:hypothetical protein